MFNSLTGCAALSYAGPLFRCCRLILGEPEQIWYKDLPPSDLLQLARLCFLRIRATMPLLGGSAAEKVFHALAQIIPYLSHKEEQLAATALADLFSLAIEQNSILILREYDFVLD